MTSLTITGQVYNATVGYFKTYRNLFDNKYKAIIQRLYEN